MKILKMAPPKWGGPDMLAEFIIQLNPDLRICGVRLLKTPTGYNIHFPKVSGGGPAVTVSPELRAQIINVAATEYKGLTIGQDTTAAQTAA